MSLTELTKTKWSQGFLNETKSYQLAPGLQPVPV
jgi:hypothetical protein